jgi:hypothetical protein
MSAARTHAHRFARALALGALGAAVLLAAGCHTTSGPQFRVIGVRQAPQRGVVGVVFVQVTNPAGKPMRLTHLAYSFAAAGATLARGDVPLARDIPAGGATVVEVPIDRAMDRAIDRPAGAPISLVGELTAQLDEMIRIFPISAPLSGADAAVTAGPSAAVLR